MQQAPHPTRHSSILPGYPIGLKEACPVDIQRRQEWATIEAVYRSQADPQKARAMKTYMRDQFEFLGLPTPLRRRLSKPYLLPLRAPELRQGVEHLWGLPEREFQYFALGLIEKSRKLWTADLLETWEWLVRSKSWWDTVDALASNVVGPHLTRFPHQLEVTDRWIESDDFWLQRTALLYQLGYREKTDSVRLFAYIDRVAPSREFFLRKAIGWALRQYARTNPEAVRSFVLARGDKLSGLSRREALKHLAG